MIDKDKAIRRALDYAEEAGFRGLYCESAWYQPVLSLDEIEERLSRKLDREHADSLERVNRGRWFVQLAYQPTPEETTPDGPCVLVYDDGEIGHFYPM